MIRLIASAVLSVLANALALVVSAQILPGMALGVSGFVVAVLIFTVAAVLVEPLLRQMALRNAPALLGSSALVATLASLVVTAIVSDSLRIDSALDWVLATVLVWAIGLIARLLLPLVIFRKILGRASDRDQRR